MVDYFSLALTHALMALAVWRLLQRDDLDRDPEPVLGPEPATAAEGAAESDSPPVRLAGRRALHWPGDRAADRDA